ncbi:MAG: arsenate reductase (azurin) small subunit [Betaproteobacteria bacterium]|nr:arsenate reductase (azurin) small subunit [Betaproteobacteria bacterium]
MRQAADTEREPAACMSRREFLLTGGLAASIVALGALPGLAGAATGLYALRAEYPRLRVGSISTLKEGIAHTFDYPYPGVTNILAKLGTPAGGGIGTGNDIVAFNTLCTHLGGDLSKAYKPEHQLLGPCPRHLTTFDLTRHGMVVTGHATESLPQIVLEAGGDDIYAVGVMGLIYGFAGNLQG